MKTMNQRHRGEVCGVPTKYKGHLWNAAEKLWKRRLVENRQPITGGSLALLEQKLAQIGPGLGGKPA